MNRFNRMHDIFLEPEDDREDSSLPAEDDEMSIAAMNKQPQRDREEFEAERYRDRHADEE